jgi:hypothetical protein
MLLYERGSKAGFQGDFFHKLAVVKGDAKLGGYLTANGAATAAKFTTDGDNAFFHNDPSFIDKVIITNCTAIVNCGKGKSCKMPA